MPIDKAKDWAVLLILIAAVIGLALVIVNINSIFGIGAPPSSSIESVNMASFDTSRGTSPGANATVIEFYNFGCGYCREAVEVDSQAIAEFGSRVNFVFKHVGAGSKAAEAAECAADQGKRMEFKKAVFDSGKYDDASLAGYAPLLGMDSAKFNACLSSGNKTALIDNDAKEAAVAGISGTPTYVINGKVMPGLQRIEVLRSLIAAELE